MSDYRMLTSSFKIYILASLVIMAVPNTGTQTDVSKGQGRIADGSDATPGQFPWLVSIQRNHRGLETHICMGALLDKRHVLTAGHCGKAFAEDPLLRKKFRVVLGAHVLNNASEKSQAIHKLCRFHMHPKYKERWEWDVGIFTLIKPVNYTERIKPIRLIPPRVDPTGQLCSVAGWGMRIIPHSTDFADILQTLNVTVRSEDECKAMNHNRSLAESVTCATAPKGQLPSDRDDGTPLVCEDENGPYAAGVYMKVSGWVDYFSMYEKVSDIKDFILCTNNKRTKG